MKFLKLKKLIESIEDLQKAQDTNTDPSKLNLLSQHEHPEIRKAVAGNPMTHPDTLHAMAQTKDNDVREAVAGNPNAYPHTLLPLAIDHTEKVNNNPAWSLFELEDPTFSSLKNHKYKVSILNEIGDSIQDHHYNLMKILARVGYPALIQDLLHGYENMPTALVQELSNHKNEGVVARALEHPNQDPQVLRSKFHHALENENHQYLHAILKNKNTPHDVFEKVLHSNEVHLYPTVASNPSIPVHIQDKLADEIPEEHDWHGDKTLITRRNLADNQNIHPAILDKLAKQENPDRSVLHSVMEHPNLSLPTLIHTIYHYPQFIEDALQHKIFPPEEAIKFFSQLPKDATLHFSNFAQEALTPTPILDQLANHTSNKVKSSVAGNENTSPHILDSLSDEYPEEVASNSKLAEKTAQKLFSTNNHRVHMNLAYNKGTPANIIRGLHQKYPKNQYIHQGIIVNRNTPLDVLDDLNKNHPEYAPWFQ